MVECRSPKSKMVVQSRLLLFLKAHIAQLVECFVVTEEVVGAIPTIRPCFKFFKN